MGLSDRLSQRPAAMPGGGHIVPDAEQPTVPAAAHRPTVPAPAAPANGRRSGSHERYYASARQVGDPIAEVRKRVHKALLDQLGPKLYDEVGNDDDLAKRVAESVQILLARDETPLAGADRQRISREVTD